jgi:hypothetical protein
MSATDLAFTVSGSPGDYIASAIAGNVNVGISNAGFDNINAGSYAVTLLGVGLYLGNDNELLYPDTPYLTGGGFSFTLLGLPGFFQVYSGSTNGSLYSIEFSSSVFIRDGMSSFSVSETPTATPLPSTWLMLLGGLVGLGFIAHRRSKQGTAVTATA